MWGGVRKKGAEEYVRSAGGKKKGKNKGRSQEERQWAGNQEKKTAVKDADLYTELLWERKRERKKDGL